MTDDGMDDNDEVKDAPKKGAGYKIKGGRVSFVQIPTAVIADPDLSHPAFRLFALLCAYARNDDDTFVGQAVLAEALGVSERHVRTLMAELKTAGLVQTESRGARNTNITSLAGDDDIRALYAGSLGSELPRKKPSYAQSDLRTGTRVPPLAAVPDEDAPETDDMQSYAHKDEEEASATVLPMRIREVIGTVVPMVTGTGVPIRREVEAGEVEAGSTSTTHEVSSTSTSSDLVEEEDSYAHSEDTKVKITYVTNDDGDVQVFIGPAHIQDSLREAGLLEEVQEIAFLAKSIQTHIREHVLEMAFQDGIEIAKQVDRFREAVLEVRSGRW